MAWPVPYACTQPYHLGSGSHEQLFPCIGDYQHGIAIEPLIRDPLLHSRLLIRAGGGGEGAEITHSNIEHDPQLLSVEIKGQLKK